MNYRKIRNTRCVNSVVASSSRLVAYDKIYTIPVFLFQGKYSTQTLCVNFIYHLPLPATWLIDLILNMLFPVRSTAKVISKYQINRKGYIRIIFLFRSIITKPMKIR